MKKNSTLESRLMKYSAVAGSLVAVVGSADAQIVYTDVNPDVNVTGHQMGAAIDMDNDATDDFFAVTLDATSAYTTYYPPYGNLNVAIDYKAALLSANTGNSWIGVSTTSADLDMLNSGTVIDAAAVWNTNSASGGANMAFDGMLNITTTGGTPLITNYPIVNGLWAAAVDKYAGVKFTSGANTYYGWIRFDVSGDAGTITLKDFAYNSTANQPINAGQTVGVEENMVEALVSVRNANNNLMITVDGDLKNGSASLMTINGQEVAAYNVQNGTNTFSLEGLSAGIYVVTVKFEQGVMTKKIFVR